MVLYFQSPTMVEDFICYICEFINSSLIRVRCMADFKHIPSIKDCKDWTSSIFLPLKIAKIGLRRESSLTLRMRLSTKKFFLTVNKGGLWGLHLQESNPNVFMALTKFTRTHLKRSTPRGKKIYKVTTGTGLWAQLIAEWEETSIPWFPVFYETWRNDGP